MALPWWSSGRARAPPALTSNSRDISLADTTAKDFHSFLRTIFIGHVEEAALDTQCGGLGGRGTDHAMHVSRAHWHRLHSCRIAGAQLLLDLSAAFASVVRELLFTKERSKEAAAHVLPSSPSPRKRCRRCSSCWPSRTPWTRLASLLTSGPYCSRLTLQPGSRPRDCCSQPAVALAPELGIRWEM